MGWQGMTPRQFAIKVREQTEEYTRRRIMRIFRQVIIMSPVDTGAFRGNHRLGINGMESGAINSFDKSGGKTIGKAEREILHMRMGDFIYIYNNLPYAIPLEDGHSDQAPLGIYSQAVQMNR